MNKNEASVKLTYDKVKDGLFSVKIRVCYQQERPRYHLPIKETIIVKPDVYKRLVSYHQTRSKQTAKDIQQLYSLIEPFLEKAESICKQLTVFSFPKFEALFYNKLVAEESPGDVISFLHQLYILNDSQGRIGNADSYNNARKSMIRFLDSITVEEQISYLHNPFNRDAPVLPFESVTIDFLNHYERWMLQYGRVSKKKEGGQPKPATLTTVGIYLRQVRAAFNEAIRKKVITKDTYPFGPKDFVIPAGANTKKAIKKSIIRQIIEFDCEPGSFQERGRDLWVLSYLTNGMNLSDICSMRWSQVDYNEKAITFTRNKTSRTRRGNQIKVVASLFPESEAIIERWGTKTRILNEYVFPFVNDSMSPRQKKMTITQVINVTNKHMKLIGKALGVAMDIRTYEARHSFASAVLKAGGDVVYIKDKLGQSTITSTESYLTSIHDEDEQSILRKSLLDT